MEKKNIFKFRIPRHKYWGKVFEKHLKILKVICTQKIKKTAG